MKAIIIGGVAAGMSAASKIKRTQKDAQVTVYEKGGYLSYGACGLAYYVGGYNDDHRKMIARSRAAFEEMGIKTFLHHEVLNVDTRYKVVSVKNLETGEVFRDTYDKLMVSTGANAVMPPVVGAEKSGIYPLKTMEDGILLKEAVNGYGVNNVVVIGGGYTGVEAVQAMRRLDKKVVLLEAAPRILATFDEEVAAMAAKEIEHNGVTIRTGEAAKEYTGRDAVTGVVTEKASYEADLVVISAGIRPSTDFLRGTGVELAQNGAVVIDRQMRASVPDIYAAGDCALVYDCVKKQNTYLPLGTTANKCGRIAGGNMCGGADEYVGTAATAAVEVFGLQLGRTGLSQKEAEDLGFYVGTVTVEASNHPPYYPGQEKMTIKLIYEKPSFRILGAQIAGGEGAAIRTNIFALAIQQGMTTKELGMADLVYSPPYANVWDAVHIACNAAR